VRASSPGQGEGGRAAGSGQASLRLVANPLTVATFRSWRGSRQQPSQDPTVIAIERVNLIHPGPDSGRLFDPAWAGFGLQGTADPPS